ncbi:bifunctional phosphopantothenoylcysteine decarboxylase/phosphopantothenate--cysteine ligase CoaBC [Allosphingosinicella deserti]|uniref:Coenzyme A biosynthesis bifunctional protein CoaBC n=1 Tax=Allosphingosinicella deserti TaxID=2116704 RepID=A0A2P7QJ97_9SPHN|nr:bifunctional phosphopantothenoylcysteine decarboxylase/phosphopantothenate--cysteine ligase CoaBC [Sphingomonas deserti]PSJ38042.1 bifunctional phosphopantothenoylcysteine decarboxylase/phosphopantothenate--cysteine ligase CoaBC [Sphingomonas deserti]
MNGKRILLIVGGGIAAYKACELIRLIRKAGGSVRCVLTKSGAEFVTPMTLAALSEQPVHTSLWDLKDEVEMGHIQLSREADVVLVCPATADLMARMAAGIADDLAATLLLATDKPVIAVPAMNVRMWLHAATRRNVERLRADGVTVVEPDEGDMACGEYGPGRLPEPSVIVDALKAHFAGARPGAAATGARPADLAGRHILVTAGPTHEPIDPVRVIANRSSGKQGFAIAGALARRGARVSLVAGPVSLPTPAGVDRIDVETAEQMKAAVETALPADAAVLVAAVADWRVESAGSKLKKADGPPQLRWTENPDILAGLAASDDRPALLVGFAAETQNVVEAAKTKRLRKGCDWIVANDVSGDVMGGERNRVHIVSSGEVESWEEAPKDVVASRLAERIAIHLTRADRPT